MICPGTQIECDNPGCRHGGCQGRLPQLPLFQAVPAAGSIMGLAQQPRPPLGTALGKPAEPLAA